jgi:uncharacterized protein YktA (UPF0223 family)
VSDEPEEFHPYVRLLLARMKSNPDEYHPEYRSDEMDRVKTFLTDVERAALHAAERDILLGRYHQNLMQTILKSNEPEKAEDEKYRAAEIYARGANAGQVLTTSQNGYTWTSAMDHDAYLAQKQAAQRQHAALMNAQQSSLMQNQLGGLAQSQQGRLYNDPSLYSGGMTIPTTTASALGLKAPPNVLVPDNGSTTASTWGGVVNKILGR